MDKLLVFSFIFMLLSGLSSSPANAEVYLTKEQALQLILGENHGAIYEPHVVTQEIEKEIRKLRLPRFLTKKIHFFVKKDRAKKDWKYALIDNVIGKHQPITYIAGFDANGNITQVEIMIFREIRGWEVRERRFLKQLEHHSPDDKATASTPQHITGATISCEAITTAIRRAEIVWQILYGNSLTTNKVSAEKNQNKNLPEIKLPGEDFK
ncbi:MAG: FMN-binding protein [bacterium]|nr:FMN-binding protein [bacterium]